jgi:C4-dicarboxylate-specific signal transduction histidine kinase
MWEALMDLDRGTLARIDRKLLAGFGQDEAFHMVRVPMTAAEWSTWKRYCDAAGVSMGRAIAALINQELIGVFGDFAPGDVPAFARRAEEELAERERRVAEREREVTATEERLRGWSERLRAEDSDLRAVTQRLDLASKQLAAPRRMSSKIGRNERCPCGSGLKYKHCHGLAGRQDR